MKTTESDASRHASAGMATLCTHADHPDSDPYGAHTMPLYQTSTFRFETVEAGARFFRKEEGAASHCYSRLGNPTVEQLERVMARMEAHGLDEPAEALMFGSGMAAISSGIMGLGRGGTVLSQDSLYGGTSAVMRGTNEAYGIHTIFAKAEEPESFRELLMHPGEGLPPVKLVYLESVANPTMRLADIAIISEMAHKAGAKVMVDNTFGTPYHIRPLELGADVVAYSTTKYQAGHGTVVGGALVGTKGMLRGTPIADIRKNFGGIAGPFDAWLTLNGLKTLPLRMERHASNAMAVAQWLERQPQVERVWYPGLASHPDHALASRMMHNGFGGMISFELEGGYEAGVHMMEHVKVCTLAVSLGAVDSLIQHPASMTHANVPKHVRYETGITDGMVRFSVGIEDVEDIIADLAQAMI
jgi:methionine-gamma-lyase